MTLLATMWQAEPPKGELRIYEDDRLGFSFRYPADYLFTTVLGPGNSFSSGVLRRGNAEILVQAADLASYPEEWRAQGRTRFVDAAVAIAMLMCDADGPDGSRSCPEVLRQSTFSNKHGLECLEIHLREVITREQPRQFTMRTKGPIYAVHAPGPTPPVILFFAFDSDYSPRAADAHTLQEIVNSVRGKQLK